MDLDTDDIDMELSLGTVIVAGILTLTVAVLVMAYRLGLFHQLIYKVEPNSTKHGGEIVANILKVHNVKFVFTLVGGHISPILVACEKIGIRVIDTRHEVSAVFAADAVARLTGGIGVAIVTAGPGVTNTVTAVKNAQMAESPVLLIGGAASTLLKCRGALQDIDQLSLFKTLCKFTTSVKTVRDIAPVLRQAINIALSGTPGPVFVEFPIDVLYPYHIVNKHIAVKSGSGIVSKVLNWYLQIYIRNLFVGAWHPTDVTPIKVTFPEATSSEVQQCVELVSRATRPVIVLGSQVMLPPTSAQSLREALEYLGFPCFLGGMARGMLGKDNSIHIRNRRADVLKKADLVILAGTVCDFRLSYGRILSRHSDIIAVNRDRSQLLKNSDMFWKPKIAIQGDAGSFLVKLADRLTGYKSPHEWTESLKEKDIAIDKMNSEKRTDKMEQHLNPLHVLYCTDKALVENSIIVADGGDFVGSCAKIVQTHGPLQWLDPGAFGTLGVGGGFALGAKLCRPESEVWIIYGDGSVGYSIAEFDTFIRHKIPVIALVGNDACWSQISREQVPMLGSSVACNLNYTDYHKVAEGYGAKGFYLNTDNGKFTDDLLIEAKLIARTGVPTLINALIGKSDFREGSISV